MVKMVKRVNKPIVKNNKKNNIIISLEPTGRGKMCIDV